MTHQFEDTIKKQQQRKAQSLKALKQRAHEWDLAKERVNQVRRSQNKEQQEKFETKQILQDEKARLIEIKRKRHIKE